MLIGCAVLVAMAFTSPAQAQGTAGAATARQTVSGATARRAPTAPTAVHRVDIWLVTRFRDAQLLRDSVRGPVEVSNDAPMPRIESAIDGPIRDTLFAVHFGSRREMEALRTGARVRLTAPSGAITSLTADVVARRLFRAPRRPGADTMSANGWRYGWAYLALVRRAVATPATTYRGWLLVEVPDSTRRR